MGVDAALHARGDSFLSDVLSRVRNEGERLPRDDHGTAEVDSVRPAEGEGFAVARAVQSDAADLLAVDKLLEVALRFESSRPAIRTDLLGLRRIDAVQPVPYRADLQRISVDHGLPGRRPNGEQADGDEAKHAVPARLSHGS